MRSSNYEDLVNAFPEASKYIEGRSIDDCHDIEYIVSNPAYIDFSPRTIKGLKKEDILLAFNGLACEICRYFHINIESQESFDKWHNNTCESFIEKFKDLSGIKINYGKAQKILNMSFKYLFCFEGFKKTYQKKFEFCHMPLDTYTISWFCDEIVNNMNNNLSKDKISISIIKDNSWSNLNYGSKKEAYSYAWIQYEIRDFLSKKDHKYIDEKGNSLTPFLAEFYIWPEQKFKEACKLFENMPLCQKDYPKFQDDDIKKICEQTSIHLSTALDKFNS